MFSKSIVIPIAAQFLLGNQVVAALTNSTSVSSSTPPCDLLIEAGLGDLLVFATDSEYETCIDSFWSACSRLHPWCFVQPTSSEEVAKALTTLLDAGDATWGIAVKGGGHSSWVGSNNIANGVTIDLGLMHTTTYDAASNIASVGPGGNWSQVYTALTPYNVTVVGGRDASVGISGFLLGGGNSYYTGTRGFGCDNVANYEIVLTNGTIANANKDTNADLFKALKGGGSNFGIVTRFDLEAIPSSDIYAGAIAYSLEHTDETITAFYNFGNNADTRHEDSTILVFYYQNTSGSDIFIMSQMVNAQGQTNTTSFDEFLAIPSTSGSMGLAKLVEFSVIGITPPGYRSTWFTLNFANEVSILKESVALFEELVETLKTTLGPNNFLAELVFQPVPSHYADIGAARGGNMLPLDGTRNGVMYLLEVNTYTEEDEAVAHFLVSSMTAEVQAYAESVGGDMDWVYLNYADASQDPLASYSSENIQYIRDVAAKYDPKGYFQTRVPGGFKISRVA